MPALRTAIRRFFYACLFLPAIANADCAHRAYAAIAADVVSTEIALRNGGREANPIYGSDPSTATLVGVGLARAGIVYVLDRAGQDHINCVLARGIFGVAVGNLAVAAGIKQPAALGLGFAVTVPFW